jgi:hypothetical protein
MKHNYEEFTEHSVLSIMRGNGEEGGGGVHRIEDVYFIEPRTKNKTVIVLWHNRA